MANNWAIAWTVPLAVQLFPTCRLLSIFSWFQEHSILLGDQISRWEAFERHGRLLSLENEGQEGWW